MWMANGSDETILANTSNIGLGGMCVHLNQEIDVGTKADIIINFINPTAFFKCRGKVILCQKENVKFFKIVIQFEPISEPNRVFLEGRISELIGLEQKGKS
jgi:hypothetical protein